MEKKSKGKLIAKRNFINYLTSIRLKPFEKNDEKISGFFRSLHSSPISELLNPQN